jgi:hypothetical protein
LCDCGNKTIQITYSVRSGKRKECPECANKSRAKNISTHGLIKHPLYRNWQDMKNRCRNPNTDRYNSYGGRGIVVCKQWDKDFKAYHDWCVSNGWKKGMSVDRIDVNGNYEPANCRIIPIQDQHYNKRNTYYVEVDGNKYSLSMLLRDNNLSNKYALIWLQLKKGWDFNRHIEKYNIKLPTIKV